MSPDDEAGKGKRGTVLCLDDDPVSLRVVRILLIRDFRVLPCTTVEEAEALIQEHAITHFVSDYHLEDGETGTSALTRLNLDPRFRPAHCVLITALPTDAIEEEVRRAGFDAVFHKPLGREFATAMRNRDSQNGRERIEDQGTRSSGEETGAGRLP